MLPSVGADEFAWIDRQSDTPKYEAGEVGNMTEAEDAQPAYDPRSPTPPAREPPRRSTAPQSDFTMGQVGFGFVVLVVGLALAYGVPILLG
jgi:hypothetical protein